MRPSVGRTFVIVALGLALVGCGPQPVRGSAAPALAAATTTAGPSCGITWGSGAKDAGPLSTAPLLTVRTGRHECWDRVVFEFDGTAQGYAVRYAAQVPTDGEGLDLVPYTAGAEHLWVTLRAPAYAPDRSATFAARTGDHVVNLLRYDTLRDVVFGGSFEGYTTFAVGVRARLPFRVLLLAGPGSHSRIVVDVAHRW